MPSSPHRTAREEVLAIIDQFGLALSHPPSVLAEVDAWLGAPGLDDPTLDDLEAIPFVTIDNEDSRDLDQALHIEALPTPGAHRVRYALADAAYYVRPGSALYDEALARGASYYLPGLVLPMLPAALSEGLVSLNADELRRALVFEVDLDPRGEVTHIALRRARIRSRAKLSYAGVQRFWDGDTLLENRDFSASLHALRVVGRQRIALAEARGVVSHPRVEIDLGFADPSGRTFVAFEAKRYETDRANEQISLLVNVEGARLLAAHPGASFLEAVFRVHPAPSSDQLAAFSTMTSQLVALHGLDPDLAWAPAEPLAPYLARIATRAPTPIAQAVQRQALLMNQRSTFAAEPGLHYGVGAPCYARFSSPMREIVGVHTHKEALELLGFLPGRTDHDREAVIASANRAKDLQGQLTRAVNQCAIEALFLPELAQSPRPVHAGVVMGFGADKAYIQLDAPPLEVKVYARDLGRLVLADATRLVIETLDKRLDLRLGDRVALTVRSRDTTRNRVVFDLKAA